MLMLVCRNVFIRNIFLPLIEYGSITWGSASKPNIRIILRAYFDTTSSEIFKTRKCVYETLCPKMVSHFQEVKMSKKRPSSSCKKVTNINLRSISTFISSKHGHNVCKVSKVSVLNCRRSCAHKVPSIHPLKFPKK